MASARRGRPATPPARILAAADALFAAAPAPGAVTMDAVAVAAGVGKGTLFRAFGSREALLDALWSAKLASLRDALEADDPALGTNGLPGARIVALLGALLTFKLENRHLIRAREAMSAGLLRSEHYRWGHDRLRSLIETAAPHAAVGYAGYAAHALLAALHLDIIDDLLARSLSAETIRSALTAHALAIVHCAPPG